MLKKKIFVTITIAILISISINLETLFNINFVYADDEDEDIEEEINEEINEMVVETATKINNEPIINARAAIIYDRTTKEIIWGKNENVKKAMASTTKIMTAIVVLENCNLNDEVIISKKAAGIGGSKLKLNDGDKITVEGLLYGLLLKSGNDTAIALAEHTAGSVEEFANMMNKKAKELGLNNTNFVTPHGLDNDNHYTTAYELAILTDYALKNETFSKIVNTKNIIININGNPRAIGNTNELLGNLNRGKWRKNRIY